MFLENLTGIGKIAPFGAITGMFLAFGILMILILIGIYVYCALAWSTIAKKLGYDKPWLAWIPVANFFLIPILAKKSWAWGFIFLLPVANIVFWIIWTWNIFEQRGFPGALSLFYIGIFIPTFILPVINGLAFIGILIVYGIVAWSERSSETTQQTQQPTQATQTQ